MQVWRKLLPASDIEVNEVEEKCGRGDGVAGLLKVAGWLGVR